MKFNKVFSTALAAAMAMSLTACGSSSSSSSSSSTSDSDSGDAFVLGGSGPLTGDAAVYGNAVKNAAELAVEEVNAEGKVKFNLVFQDDEADAEKAPTAYNNLMDQGMQVSLGCVTSGAGQAVSQNYEDDNIFALTPSASSAAVVYKNADDMSDPYTTVFQMCFVDPNQGAASAEYISEHPDLGSKIGIIYRNDDNYSTGIYNTFKSEAEELGLEIVAEEGFADGTTDYSTYVKACEDAGADIVFMPIYYQPASQILIQADKDGYTPTFFGCDGMDGILSLEGFDTSLAEGLYMLTPFAADAEDELTQNFVKNYEDKYGETPNQFAADAYDCVYALAQALENAGTKPTDSTDDITADLLDQFTSMEFSGLTGDNVTWNEDGTVSKDPKAVVIQDGAYVSAD